jgi:transposase
MRRRGRPLVIAWRDEADALYARYRSERKPDLRPRWHALWLLRTGATAREAARVLGVHERSVQQWIAWYRAGGVAEVAAHRKAGKGTRGRLTGEQQAAVVAAASTGRFRTAAAVVTWVHETWGVGYTVSGMHQLLRRRRCKPKIPRPLAEKASLAEQEAWKKGGVPPPSPQLA